MQRTTARGRTVCQDSAGGRVIHRPSRSVFLGFLSVDLLGTALLMTPRASADGAGATGLQALFNATAFVAS